MCVCVGACVYMHVCICVGKERKERNVLFNDAHNRFYLRLYGVRHMVKGICVGVCVHECMCVGDCMCVGECICVGECMCVGACMCVGTCVRMRASICVCVLVG